MNENVESMLSIKLQFVAQTISNEIFRARVDIAVGVQSSGARLAR